jgi:hypothetical protein
MTTVSDVQLGLCPNCGERGTDTLVDYYEVVSFNYSTYAVTRRRRGARWSKTWVSGKVQLCSQCASLYNRSVQYRQRGRRMINRSTAGLVAAGFFYLILYSQVVALKHGIGAVVIALPALAAFVFLCIGLVYLAAGTLMKPRSTQFLAKRLKG